MPLGVGARATSHLAMGRVRPRPLRIRGRASGAARAHMPLCILANWAALSASLILSQWSLQAWEQKQSFWPWYMEQYLPLPIAWPQQQVLLKQSLIAAPPLLSLVFLWQPPRVRPARARQR